MAHTATGTEFKPFTLKPQHMARRDIMRASCQLATTGKASGGNHWHIDTSRLNWRSLSTLSTVSSRALCVLNRLESLESTQRNALAYTRFIFLCEVFHYGRCKLIVGCRRFTGTTMRSKMGTMTHGRFPRSRIIGHATTTTTTVIAAQVHSPTRLTENLLLVRS